MTQPEPSYQVPDVQILRGNTPKVQAAVLAHDAEESRSLLLAPEEVPWRSWSAVRQLLAGALEEVGEGAVPGALERHPGAARLILDPWGPPQGSDAEELAATMAARLDSHLTHNWAVQRAAIEAVTGLLQDLLAGRRLCLRIPSIHYGDWESLAAIRGLCNRLTGRWPRLVMGFCEEINTPELDAQGICWQNLPSHVLKATRSFAALPGARSCAVKDRSGIQRLRPLTAPVALPPLFEGKEGPCRQLLQGEGDLAERECLQVVEAMEACFRRYSFSTALWLGCQLFRRAPDFAGERAARAHAIVALSAHNRQFKSEGNLKLGRFIAGHLEAALKDEVEPVIRCALHYRLAVAYGRRLGELETAEQWARQGAAEAVKLGGSDGRYQHIWANNILAYIQGRQKDGQGARHSMQEAVELACDPAYPLAEEEGGRASRFGDLALSRSLAAHNLAVTTSMCGEGARATELLEEACRLENVIDGAAKYWAQNLIRNLRIRNRPDRASICGEAGLKAAITDCDAPLQLFFRLQLGDISFRLGDAGASADHYLAAQHLATKMAPFYDELPDWDFPMEAALSEAGQLDLAEELMRDKVEAAGASGEVVAEAAARLALLAARRGESEAAEEWSTRASDTAMEYGQRHCLVRIATQLGRAARWIGQPEDAVALLEWALQIYEQREDPGSVPPADALFTLVELERCGALPEERAWDGFRLLPEALSSPSTWWLLPDLLSLWMRLDTQSERDRADRSQAVRPLLAAGQLREDCQPLLADGRERIQDLNIETSSAAVA